MTIETITRGAAWGSHLPVLPIPAQGAWGSLPADLELAEAHTDFHTRPRASQGQGDIALGEGLGLGRLDGARGGAGGDIAAKQLLDVADLGELPVAFPNLGLADRQTTTPGGDLHSRRLAIVARDRSRPARRFVKSGPTLERVVHRTDRGSGRAGSRHHRDQGEQESRETQSHVSFHKESFQ